MQMDFCQALAFNRQTWNEFYSQSVLLGGHGIGVEKVFTWTRLHY